MGSDDERNGWEVAPTVEPASSAFCNGNWAADEYWTVYIDSCFSASTETKEFKFPQVKEAGDTSYLSFKITSFSSSDASTIPAGQTRSYASLNENYTCAPIPG